MGICQLRTQHPGPRWAHTHGLGSGQGAAPPPPHPTAPANSLLLPACALLPLCAALCLSGGSMPSWGDFPLLTALITRMGFLKHASARRSHCFFPAAFRRETHMVGAQ